MLYYLARRVVLFRGEHSPRTFVERVDHVAAPGSTPPDVVRPGGPWKCVTPLCVFRCEPAQEALVVESVHPGVLREELERRTGFPVQYATGSASTPAPTREELHLLRTRVRPAGARVYPRFAAEVLGG